MIALINLEENQAEITQHELQLKGSKLITIIWAFLKNQWKQHTCIQKFTKKTLKPGYSIHFAFTSIYKKVLKIFTSVEFTFQFDLSMKLIFKISSGNKYISNFFKEFRKQDVTKKFNRQRQFQNNYNPRQTQVSEISMKYRMKYSHNLQYKQVAKSLYNKLKQSHKICDEIIDQFSHNFIYQREFSLNSKQQQACRPLECLGFIEKQNQRFRDYYKSQNNGQSLFKCIYAIESKANQILRDFKFSQPLRIRHKILQNSKGNREQGTFSNLIYIQGNIQVFDTFQSHRRQYQNNRNGLILPTDDSPNPHKSVKSMKKLICKIPKAQQQYKKDIQASFRNERYLVENIIGNSKTPYVANYYLQLQNSPSFKRPYSIQKQLQIFLDYHPVSTHSIFYGDYFFSMLDILNFALQLVKAIRDVYQINNFLHRDIKAGNILFNQGIIKLIDHGSGFPLTSNNKKLNEQLQGHRTKLDPILRSTHSVKRQDFQKDNFLVSQFKKYQNYLFKSKTHPTFDVYSIGIMLKQIIRNYQQFVSPRWMQVSHRWYKLIQKMIIKDFSKRISLSQVFTQILSIRKFLFH